MKKSIVILSALIMIFTLFTVMSFAGEEENQEASVIATGNCGAAENGNIVTSSNPATDTVKWTLYSNGLLTVSGNGPMADYDWNTTPFCNMEEIKNVVIQEGVTRIGTYGFFNCDRCMETVSIPGSVKSIGNHAFRSCEYLKEITIAEGVETIGGRVFEWCSKLEEITIPESVTKIDNPEDFWYSHGTFTYCTSLKEVRILNPNADIGTFRMFWECRNLERVVLPSNYEMLNGMFYDCSNLKYINATDECYVNLPQNITSIPSYSLEGMKSIEVLNIPEGVTSIGAEAFCESYFKVLNLPASLSEISTTSFRNCPKLEKINLADGNLNFKVENSLLTDMDATALYGVESASVSGTCTLPETLVSIPGRMFVGCENLTGIKIPAAASNIDKVAFMTCHNLEKIEIDPLNEHYKQDNGLMTDMEGKHVFLGEKADSYVIPDTVETINNHAFGTPLKNLNFLGSTVPENISTVIKNSGAAEEDVEVKTNVFAVVNGEGFVTDVNTIDEAINAAVESGSPLNIYRDKKISENVVVDEGKTLIIELNGNTLNKTDDEVITNNGLVVIKSGTNNVPVINNGKVSYDTSVTVKTSDGNITFTPEDGKTVTVDAENTVTCDGTLTVLKEGEAETETYRPTEGGAVSIKEDGTVIFTKENGTEYSGKGAAAPSVDDRGILHIPAGAVIKLPDGTTTTVEDPVVFEDESNLCLIHTWNSGVVTVKPTYTSEGEKKYTCIICGETKTEAVPKKKRNNSGINNTDESVSTIGTVCSKDDTASAAASGSEADKGAAAAAKADLAVDLVNTKGTAVSGKDFTEPAVLTIPVDTKNVDDVNNLTIAKFNPETGKLEIVGGSYDAEEKAVKGYITEEGDYFAVEKDNLTIITLQIGSNEAVVNNVKKDLDSAPIISQDRTMVPVRFIAEAFGAKVDWDGSTRTVTIELDGNVMTMVIGQQMEGFDAAPVISNDRTMVPIRYISEKFGANVIWVPSTYTVSVAK